MLQNFSLKSLLSHFRNFPVTLGTIWLFTFILTFFLESSAEDYAGLILLFLFFYGSGSFLIESVFLQNKLSKWFFFSLGCNLIPALSLVFLFNTMDYSFWNDYFTRFSVCYFLITFCLGIYFCYKKLECSFPEYLVRVFGRTIRYEIAWTILSIGVSIICSILLELFDLNYDIIIYSQMLLFGLCFMSCFLLSFYPQKSEDNLLTGVLVKYILSFMVAAAYIIIYAYILKILILWDIPSNAIFRITAGLFLVGTPVCIMNMFYQESHPLCRIISRLPYLFLPFIPLQGYSIGIRIYENGITPMRYVAVALLFFECIALSLYYFKRSFLHYLLITIVIFVSICGCIPFVNMNYISFISQKQTIEHFLSLSEEEQTAFLNTTSSENPDPVNDKYTIYRIRGAYSYLKYDYHGTQYIDSLSAVDKSLLDSLNTYNYDYNDSVINYHGGVTESIIDVADYRYCCPFDIREYEREWSENEDQGENQSYLSDYHLLPDARPELTVNLTELFDTYIKQADDDNSIQSYFTGHRTYEIDSTHILWLRELSVNYDQETKSFTYFQISGYMLEK